MKRFMAFWSTVQRFKALLTVGILVLIPFVNILATWCYAGSKLDQSVALKKRMKDNLTVGLPAFDKHTKQIWLTWLAETILVVIFTVVTIFMNRWVVSTWPDAFDADWIVAWHAFRWLEMATTGIATSFITSSLILKVNGIYVIHRNFDPEYMEEPNADYIRRRNEAIEKRKQAEAAEAAANPPAPVETKLWTE